MADKFLNLTAVQTIKTWAKSLFATDADLDALEAKVDEIIAEGGEPNVIETVKVNGTALTPDANKAVNVEAAQLSDIARGGVSIEQGQSFISFSPDAQDGSVLSVQNSQGELAALATTDYVANNGGKIQKVKYDGTELPIDTTDKSVNVPKEVFIATVNTTSYADLLAAVNEGKSIAVKTSANDIVAAETEVDGNAIIVSYVKWTTSQGGSLWVWMYTVTSAGWGDSFATRLAYTNDIPDRLSYFQNDSGYQTASDVQSAISTAVASAYKYKGSVATQTDLPASGNTAGDVWDVQDTGINYAWTGTAWDALGSYVDTSVFWTPQTGQTNTLEAATVAEINAILNA